MLLRDRRALILALFWCTIFPLGCFGQNQGGDFLNREIFLQFGGSFYTGNTGFGAPILAGPPGGPFQVMPGTRRSIFSKSGRVFGGVRYWFKQKQALEFGLSYSPNILQFLTSNPPVLTGESVPVQLNATNVAFNYVHRLGSRGRLEPFVTAGAGFGIFNGLNETETKFVINFGAGTDLQLSHRMLLRFEFRDFFSGEPTGGDLQAPGGATHNLVPSAGLVFRF